MLPRELNVEDEFTPVDLSQWRSLVDKDLAGASFERKLFTHTYEGLYVRPLYTGEDWPGKRPADASGFSGFPPCTRGGQPLANTRGGWDIRQERAEPTPGRLNEALLEDLTFGVQSVTLRLDAAARAGLDPIDPGATPLLGVDGVRISTLDDLDAALKGVYLDMIGVWLEAGASFVPAAGLLAALWEKRGIDPTKARGGFGADPLAVLARDGSLPMSLDDAMGLAGDLAVWTSRSFPHVASIRVGTAPYHHAGATATQDLAYSIATGLEYLRVLTRAGLSAEQAARQMVFSFAVGTSFFLAIAKLRAARRLWARVLEVVGVPEGARGMRQHVRASKRVLTTRDPWVNILRNAACVFAAGVGGAEAVSSVPFDAALGPASPLSRRLARNTQHILQAESHLHRVADPAGGSWYLETLTDELAARAWLILQDLEARGGMRACLTSGVIHDQIDNAFAPRATNLATRRDTIVGVSDFPNLAESDLTPEPFDQPALAAEAVASFRRRARIAAPTTLETPRAGSVAKLASAGASIGELSRALATSDPAQLDRPIAPHPFAEPFEILRDASDQYLASHGVRPRVFLASVGSPAQHLARTNFARNLLESGGFETLGGDGVPDASSAAVAFAASGCDVAVICSSDPMYETLVADLAPRLHRAGARVVVLAGNPGDKEGAFRAAGVDRFIFLKCDVVRVLTELLQDEGVLA